MNELPTFMNTSNYLSNYFSSVLDMENNDSNRISLQQFFHKNLKNKDDKLIKKLDRNTDDGAISMIVGMVFMMGIDKQIDASDEICSETIVSEAYHCVQFLIENKLGTREELPRLVGVYAYVKNFLNANLWVQNIEIKGDKIYTTNKAIYIFLKMIIEKKKKTLSLPIVIKEKSLEYVFLVFLQYHYNHHLTYKNNQIKKKDCMVTKTHVIVHFERAVNKFENIYSDVILLDC